jgi:HlyD family secretion protein
MSSVVGQGKFGFTSPGIAPPQAAITRPTPLPKRPKGRWLIGLLLLAGSGYGGFQVWDHFFRYQAYGTVTGRVVRISPPWEGEIAFVHAREGDEVIQGQLLAKITNDDILARISQLSDDLAVTQATLEAETVKVKWQAAFQLELPQTVGARYQEALGQLEQDKTTLTRLQNEYDRGQRLLVAKAISPQEADRLHFDLQTQLGKVRMLENTLLEYKKRHELSEMLLVKQGELSGGLAGDGLDQLKPYAARIAALHKERSRLEAKLAKGRLLAAVSGRVVKVHRFAGERVSAAEPFVSILEKGSLQVILYMPQHLSQSIQIGDEMKVNCDPYPGLLSCRVVRLADQYEPAPEHLKRYFLSGQHLLPVILEPAQESAHLLALRIGGTVKLP